MNLYLKKIHLLGFLIILSSQIFYSQQSWVKLNSGTTNLLYKAHFINQSLGFVVGQNGLIMKTTDGGSTWIQQNSGVLHSLQGVYFSDSNNGIVVGMAGTILKTSNGGLTWNKKYSGYSQFFSGVSFSNAFYGTIVGESGLILRTKDGGETWTSQYSGSSFDLYSVYFTDGNIGTAVSEGGEILRTTNEGKTWIKQNSGTTNFLRGVFFTNAINGYAVGWGGTILKTTDGGMNWIKQYSGTTNFLRGIHFTDVNNGVVAGELGIILRTTNGGQTWVQESIGATTGFIGVFLLNTNLGYAVGFEGTILKTSSSKFLQLLTPTNGDFWLAGSIKNITWSQQNISAIKIEYSTDNGNSWSIITNSVSAGLNNYSWNIPAINSNQCRIRIMDVNDSSIFSMGSNPFTISPAFISITKPNGGEIWTINSVQDIKWSTNIDHNIKIELSTNDGNTWNPIIENFSSINGSFSWTVPNINSTQCKIRLQSIDNPNIYDFSDQVFSIIPKLILISPNGGESIKANSTLQIKWKATNLSYCKIDYSIDNGINWASIATYVSAQTGYYNWKVPNKNFAQCKIRISDQYDEYTKAENDKPFVIYQDLILVSPNGNNIWKAGTMQKIQWTSISSENIKIEYSSNNGNSWQLIVSSISSNAGEYIWIVPNLNSTQCKIRITDTNDNFNVDESDYMFSIYYPFVTVISPNGGDMWISDSNQRITWVSNYSTSFKIDITTNNGVVWTVIAESVLSNASAYNLVVPKLTSNQCKIRISDLLMPDVFDESNQVFSIVLPTITVKTPNGGEEWKEGDLKIINWNSSFIDKVKIEYSINNGFSWKTIINSISANLNTYIWSVPNEKSNDCFVRISGVDNYDIQDRSDAKFSILPLVNVNDNDLMPTYNKLFQNSPNPFNPETTIKFSVSKPGVVKLFVYDVLGKVVSELVNEEKQIGSYFIKFKGENLPSGLYLSVLKVNDFIESKKMIFLK